MKIDIATGNNLTRGQQSAVLIKIAEQTSIANIEEAVKVFLRGTVEVVMTKIIDFVGTTTTSATTEKFVAKDFFTTDNKEVKIYNVYSNFINRFLADDGKIENPIKEQVLRYGNLTKGSIDRSIIEELGGEAKVDTTLQELADQIKKHANGEENGLLTSGYSNIFYIKDTEGVLRAVRVYWNDDGWDVSAYSVEDSNGWRAGNRVFVRNS